MSSNAEKPAAPLAGAVQIAGFRLQSEIARGGMGSVWRAYQVSMDRPVAVKVLAPKFTEDKVFVERFLKEARAAARLNHPNIVQAIDVAEADGRYYFVMEFVEGSALSALLQEHGKIPPLEACGIVAQVARALEHASQSGMLHLDVKPGNILVVGADPGMVSPAARAKLADFGLARHVAEVDTLYAEKKVIFGTPQYMSPEQIAGGELDSRSDIYSLGVTFYEMVTGRNPFAAPTTAEALRKVKAAKVSPAHEAEPAVPEDVSLVIAKMMSADREQRYLDPTCLLTDLDELCRQRPPPIARNLPLPEAASGRLGAAPRRRRTALVLAAGVLCLFMLVVALLGHFPGVNRGHVQNRPVMPPGRRGTTVAADTVRELFQTAVGEAERQMADGNFKDALKLYEEFASQHHGTSWAEEASRAATGVRNRAEWRAEGIARDADAAVTRGDYGAARALCDQIAAFQIPETEPIAREARRRLRDAEEAAVRRAETTRQESAERALAALERNLPPLLQAERFDEAARQCNEFLANKDYAQADPAARAELARVDLLLKIRAAILSGAARSIGFNLQPAPPAPTEGQPPWVPSSGRKIPSGATVAGVRDGRILVRLATAERAVDLRDLTEADLAAFAQKGLASRRSPVEAGRILSRASGANDEAEGGQAGADSGKEDALLLHGGLAALLETQARYRQALPHLADLQDISAIRTGNKRGKLPPALALVEPFCLLGAAAEELADALPQRALEDLRALKSKYQRTGFYQSRLAEVRDLLLKAAARATENMPAIPAGQFIYQNGRKCHLPLFYMDVHEVTNAQYGRFLDYFSRTQDHSFDHPFQPATKKDHVPLKWDELSKGRPNDPVVGVDWYDAFACAAWMGKRLPTDMEWEKAARGADGRKYPWGKEWGKGLCNAAPPVAHTGADVPTGVVPVGSFPQGNSPYGLTDMAGNAREWIGDEDALEPDNATTRGGSYLDQASACSTTHRTPMPRIERDTETGFRCALDPITDTP